MRQRTLFRSIERLEPGERVTAAAVMWRRDRGTWLTLGAALLAALAVPLVASRAWTTPAIAIGAVLALAMSARTEWRVVAATAGSDRCLLLEGSRIRGVATAIVGRLAPDAPLERVGATMVSSEWLVDDARYTVSKHGDKAMGQVAAALAAERQR